MFWSMLQLSSSMFFPELIISAGKKVSDGTKAASNASKETSNASDVTTTVVKEVTQVEDATKSLSSEFLSSLNKTISKQKQARHLAGTASEGKGFLNSIDDAQAVLDAVQSGKAEYLGVTKAGHKVFKVENVTGTNVNLGAGITSQPTNVFMIKGTTSPSVVPISPLFKQ